jgi:L-fucose mutarotase
MLLNRLLQPEILLALAKAGHGSRVMIADGNYPVATESPATASKVFLNLRRGLVTVPSVLEVLVETIPIESAIVMELPDRRYPHIHTEFRKLLPDGAKVTRKKREDFYNEAKSLATTLIIATGEQRRFGNILLTIGVVISNEDESMTAWMGAKAGAH